MMLRLEKYSASGRFHYVPVVILITGILLFSLVLIPPVAADPDPFGKVVEHRLANGLRVLLLKESRAPLISLQIWYRVGSRNEELGNTGISHLTEHLMFRGTSRWGSKVFSRIVQKSGGGDNAFTGRDYTAYYQNGPKTELKNWLEMEADRMKGLNVNEEGFETEKKVVLEERRLRTEDDPVNFLLEEVRAAAFKAHPYQWPVIGWFTDIGSISRDDFFAYYRQYYQPNNATVVVVGDIDPQEALALIEAAYGSIPAGPEPPKVTAIEPPQYGERRVVVHREAQFPFLVMAYHTPNWENPDSIVLELLVRLFSKGRSSRLYHRLIYKDKLALETGADYDLDTANPSLFILYGQPMPGKTVGQLESAMETEVKRFQTELVDDKELQKAKNQAAAAFYMSMDSLYYRGMVLGKLATVARWELAREFIPKINQVTAEDVRRVARLYFVANNRTVGVLSPLKTEKPMESRYRPGTQMQ